MNNSIKKHNMKATRSLKLWLSVFTFTFGLALNSFAAAPEKVEFKDLPESVQKEITAKAGKRTLSSIAKKGAGDKITYAATVKTADGKDAVFTVDADGKFVKGKEETKLKDIPEAVQATIKAKAGDKTILKIEKKSKGDKTTYATTVKGSGDKEELITVDSDGKFIKMADVVKKDANAAAKPATK